MKMKKYTKTLLAVLLVLTVVVSMMAQPGLSAQASNGDYKEMKFGDWGTEVGTSGGVKIYSLTKSGKITDLDAVAISGTVNLNGISWGDSFITIGGTDSKQEGGVQFVSTGGQWAFRYCSVGVESGWTYTEAMQVNEDVELRVTFDKVGSDSWTVNMYANKTLVGTATYSGAPMGLYIGFASGVTVDMTASPVSYTEMHFSDWGTAVGTSGGVNVYSLKQSDKITSLDGVAISGTVNLNGTSWANSFVTIGGTTAMQEGGVQFVSTGGQWAFRYCSVGVESEWTNTEATQINEDVELRITFDRSNSSNWTVKMYANGVLAGTATYSGVKFGLNIGFASGVTVDMTPPAVSYTEMNFSDWGTEVGTSGGVNIYSLTEPGTITDLDGVAISGTVNLNGTTWGDSFVTIGGTDDKKEGGVQFVSTGGQWQFRYSGANAETDWTTTEATQVNEDVELRVTFDKAGSNNWTVNMYAAGTLAGTATYNGVPLGLYIGFAPGVTMGSTTPPVISYTEMQFGDWGTYEGASEGFDIYRLTDSDAIDSLDGVAISGKVNFNGDKANYFRVGGTESLKHAGFSLMTQQESDRLILWAQGIGTDFADVVLEAADWAEMMNTEFDLRMVFYKNATTNVWTVEIHIEEQLVKTVNFNSVTPGLYIANQGVTVEGLVEPAEPVYKEMQFSDWGTSVGKSEGYDVFSLTDGDAITSLDGVAISGKANFNGQAYKWLTVGGTADAKHGGFWLGAVQENGWTMACQGIGADAGDSIQWSEAAKFDQEVELRLTFDKATDSNAWTIGVYADDVLVGTWTYDGATPGLYIGLDASLTVEGLEVKKPVVPTFPNTYTELKFSDFGIYAGVMEGMDIYTLKGRSEITSLDGVAISGKVNYNDVLNGKISIGGTDALKHAGFWLFNDGENLRLTPQGIGNVTIDHWVLWKELWAPMRNVDVDFRMTFNKKADTGEWWVGIHINNEKIGVFNCGAVTPGLYLGVHPSVTVEGLGDAVKFGGIDFELFGYSNDNWRKEMGLN